jgi:broad specificity phosphatase PhoE
MVMNLPKKLVLIRHAESERNKVLDGALFVNDPTLFEKIGKIPDHKIGITEEGKVQARKVSKEIVGVLKPDIVLHSGYRRTKETTEEILSEFDKESILVKEDLSIREREGGYTHTLLESEKNVHFPYLQDYWDIVGGLFARPVGGESLMDVIEQRLKPFLRDLFEEYSDKTIFLVTHGRVIQCLRFILDEMTWEEMEEFLSQKESAPSNCGVTIYEPNKEKNKLELKVWNKIYWK